MPLAGSVGRGKSKDVFPRLFIQGTLHRVQNGKAAVGSAGNGVQVNPLVL